jgi:hypothetical protein
MVEEVTMSRSHAAQDAEQQIRVEGALVRLVHDHGRVVVQIRVAQRLAQQHAVSHELNAWAGEDTSSNRMA